MFKMRGQGMTVIKAGETGPILKRLSTVDLADHMGEARDIVEAAKRHARRTLAEAEENRERLAAASAETAQKQGYEEGFATGKREGHAAAFQESTATFDRKHAGLVAMMQQAVSDIGEWKETLRIAAERDLLEFAVKLATDLTLTIGRVSRESVIENLKRALRMVGSRTDLTIRVHPDDVQAMETYASGVLTEIDATSSVAVIRDDSVSPGGCIVETDRSKVDATLETQIEELTALLLGDRCLDNDSGATDLSGGSHD